MSDKPRLLVATPLEPKDQALFASHFDVVYAPDATAFETAIVRHGMSFHAALVRNVVPIGYRELERMPALEIVVALGSGTDSIDDAALKRRAVRLATGKGVNANAVADHAMALSLALIRDLPGLDNSVSAKGWGVVCPPPRSISGSRIGIIGLGAIGMAVARRAEAFDMTVAYQGPSQKAAAPWTYHADPAELAAASQILVLCCPGGDATRHLVDTHVLSKLGPDGIVINVARGSVIDTGALLEALEKHEIAAAGLDVLEATIAQVQRLVALPNVLLTPHTAGRSPQSLEAAHQQAFASLYEHFSDS